ncbi:MAG: DUF362 domain-containing protein [Candidatus Geothermarchaeales archaeon]
MTFVDKKLCVGCGFCLPYCPVNAITMRENHAHIDQEKCVECASCVRSGVCEVYALVQPDLKLPRLLRKLFSDPLATFKETEVPGRGTEEMKTNDVSNNFGYGDAGWGVELGRPSVSTSFEDVEKVAMALAKHNVEFLELNPVSMCIDPETGEFKEDNPWRLKPETLRKVRSLSAIIEFKSKAEDVPTILETLKDVSEKINTVFTVDLISRWRDGEIEVLPIVEKIPWVTVRPNGKNNVGLGRPGYE